MPDRPPHRAWKQVVILLLVCAGVYWLALGARPLDFSEGHRCVPAWTMLRTGDWWRQTMFELEYVRKPPGMTWSIAAAASVLGERAWSARAVRAASATLMSLIAMGFARRWLVRAGLHPRWGLLAGLVQALTPALWPLGRSAEIEMLCLLGAQLMALSAAELLVLSREARARTRVLLGCVLALGVVVTALAKGPAAAPALLGVLVGSCLAARSFRPLLHAWFWLGLALAAAVLVPIGLRFVSANAGADAVREDLAREFLWSPSRVAGVLALAPVAALSALPASIGLLALWPGRSARPSPPDATRPDPRARTPDTLARALALSWCVGVLTLVLAGVSNPRYVLPVSVLLAPLATLVLADWAGKSGPRTRAVFAGCLIMLVAGLAHAVITSMPTEDRMRAVLASDTLAAATPPGTTIWADDAIEARPDILWNAQRLAEARGSSIRVRWAKPEFRRGELPPPGSCLLIRTDDQSTELARLGPELTRTHARTVVEFSVRRHTYRLYALDAR